VATLASGSHLGEGWRNGVKGFGSSFGKDGFRRKYKKSHHLANFWWLGLKAMFVSPNINLNLSLNSECQAVLHKRGRLRRA